MMEQNILMAKLLMIVQNAGMKILDVTGSVKSVDENSNDLTLPISFKTDFGTFLFGKTDHQIICQQLFTGKEFDWPMYHCEVRGQSYCKPRYLNDEFDLLQYLYNYFVLVPTEKSYYCIEDRTGICSGFCNNILRSLEQAVENNRLVNFYQPNKPLLTIGRKLIKQFDSKWTGGESRHKNSKLYPIEWGTAFEILLNNKCIGYFENVPIDEVRQNT